MRVGTRLYYKQTKFNLIREECEGFAKLIVKLNTPLLTKDQIKATVSDVCELIGYFLLDPNRVADVISSVAENEGNNQQRHGLIELFKLLYPVTSKSHFTNLVGFRLTPEQSKKAEEKQQLGGKKAAASSSTTNIAKIRMCNSLGMRKTAPYGKPLYDWIYELLKEDCIDLLMLLSHLTPNAQVSSADSFFHQKFLKQQSRVEYELEHLGEEDAMIETNKALTAREYREDHVAGLTAVFLKNSNWEMATIMFEHFNMRQLLHNPIVQQQFCGFVARELDALDLKYASVYHVFDEAKEVASGCFEITNLDLFVEKMVRLFFVE